MEKKEEKSLKKVKPDITSDKIEKFKKRWLIKSTSTLLLVGIMIAMFVAINFGMKKWDPTPVDFSTSKDYTLTEQSKERVKNVEKDVNIYFIKYNENSLDYKLAKQYNKANSKINVELLDITENIEKANKFEIKSENQEPTVVIECGETYRKLSSYDLTNYDYSTGKSVDIAEQKITSAILNVITDIIPKAYFLTGYTDFSFKQNLMSLETYLQNEVLEYEEINLLNKQTVPEDCNVLIIMTPNKDFDDITTKAILEYIKKGGNILWFNGIYKEEKDFKNVNKILAEYGVNKFEKGILYETNANKIFGYDTCYAPDVQNNPILKDVKNGEGSIFFNGTKININKDELEAKKVEEVDLMLASETSYFTKDLTGTSNGKNDIKGSFVVGAELIKTVKEAETTENEENTETNDNKEKPIKSTLIIYGNDIFISDAPIAIGQSQVSVFYLFNNADVALNSIAYLTNNDQEITIRKSYTDSQTTFTPSEQEKQIIITIIFIVPIAIIIAGIIVWIIRKRRK